MEKFASSADVASIEKAVADYYARKLDIHGPTPRGVDWKDEASQQLRHRQFLRLLNRRYDASVFDLGCGYGDFLAFMRAHAYGGPYVGYDIAPTMTAAAERIHGVGPDRRWKTASVPDGHADYVIASGIFNVKQTFPASAWEAYVMETIEAMASASVCGFGFNMLSLHSDPDRRRDDLYYGDPAIFLDRVARRYGRHVALLQDYGLYEFTLLVRRQ